MLVFNLCAISGALRRIINTHLPPFDFLHTLSLHTFQQRCKHNPLMQGTILEVRCRRTVLQHLDDLLHILRPSSTLLGMHEFHCSSKSKLSCITAAKKADTYRHISSALRASPLMDETFIAANLTPSAWITSGGASRPSLASRRRACTIFSSCCVVYGWKLIRIMPSEGKNKREASSVLDLTAHTKPTTYTAAHHPFWKIHGVRDSDHD